VDIRGEGVGEFDAVVGLDGLDVEGEEVDQAVQEIADKVRRPTRLLGFRRESAVSDQLVDEVGLDPSAMRM